MIRARAKIWKFAGAGLVLLLGCSGRLDVGDTSGSGGAASSGRNLGGAEALSVGGNASVLGTAKSCPSTPSNREACDVENAVCGYWQTDASSAQSYTECGCYEASAGVLQWLCYFTDKGKQGCPLTEPKFGSACFGSFGAQCWYPVQTACSCSDLEKIWICTAQRTLHDYLEPPTTLDLGKPISQLSDSERRSLCRWYVDAHSGPGFPAPPDVAVGADGFVERPPCAACWDFASNARLPTLSLAQCESNLRLSACMAPASDLVDCVATIYDQCSVHGHGCARYMERPGCDGTLLTGAEDPSQSLNFCGVRVQ